MMSDQQIFSVLQDLLAARRELCARGFVDETVNFRAKLGPKTLFALSRRLEMGTVSFVGVHHESDSPRGEVPIVIQVIVHDHGFEPEVREFLQPSSSTSLGDALALIQQLSARFGLESAAA
jgi:hypothetical protein